jgi:hypothetical protein
MFIDFFFMVVEVFLYSFIINQWLDRGLGTKRGPWIMARRKKRDKRWMWVAKPGDKMLLVEPLLYPQRSYLEENSEH